jgi:hypothetical protein
MQPSYWRKQTTTKPLFPDIEWNKPERRDQAGQLGIIGGNKLGFAGVAEAYSGTLAAGVGAVRTLLPDALKRNIPATITDTIFAASNPSGGLARDALIEMNALGNWANSILLIGDAGRNSETALVYDDFISGYDGPLTVTRDAVDLVKNNANLLVDRPNTLLIVSFAQLQRLFQGVYYPKILTLLSLSRQFINSPSPIQSPLLRSIATHSLSPATARLLHKNGVMLWQFGAVIPPLALQLTGFGIHQNHSRPSRRVS